jgi:hypothetical protein
MPSCAKQRRFVVIDASSAQIQNTPYSGAIIEEINNGGLEALMHHLLEVDLNVVDLRKILQNDALSELQVLMNSDGFLCHI